MKQDLHKAISRLLDNLLPGHFYVMSQVTSMVGDNFYLPDVGAWRVRPTRDQSRKPIQYNSPQPDLWIEVFTNVDFTD